MTTNVQASPKWVNYGDVNPIEHGGTWVQKESETCYRIIKLEFDHDAEKNRFSDLYVDISDNWIEKESVMSYADVKEDDEQYAVRYAIACTDYYSPENFGYNSFENVLLTFEESADYIGKYGIVVE